MDRFAAIRYLLVCGFCLIPGLFVICCQDDSAKQTQRDCRLTVYYEPEEGHTGPFYLVGDFNNWEEGHTRLVDQNEDGVYVARLALPPGPAYYRIWDDGELLLDANNPLTAYDEQEKEQSFRRIADCSQPELQVHSVEINEGKLDLQLRLLRNESDLPIDPESLSVQTAEGLKLGASASVSSGEIVATGSLPLGKSWLQVKAKDIEGNSAELSFPVWNEEEPFDWQDATIYQIVVDRFRKGQGVLASGPISHYLGGDLKGIQEAIEQGYFEELGVNVLWLSPLYDNPEGLYFGLDDHWYEAYHGYWPSDSLSVEPHFGTPEDLDNLVKAAHQKGIRVLMDLVPNHVHQTNPYFIENKDKDWFNFPDGSCVCGRGTCSWATDIEYCWFTEYLPDFNWKKLEVVDRMRADALAWLKRFDLDGFRIDAVAMMPRLATRQLRDAFRTAIDIGGTRTYLIGETYTGSEGQGKIRWYLGPQGLDGQFDFPLMWQLREVIAHGSADMELLQDTIDESEAAWEGSGAVMGLILGNHDVTRFISEANDDPLNDSWGAPPEQPQNREAYQRLALAFAVLFTLPGAPIIYYGDEIGLPGASDPDNRRPFPVDVQLNEHARWLREQVQQLGQLRQTYSALRRGSRRSILAEDSTLGFLRESDDADSVLILLNGSTQARKISLDLQQCGKLKDANGLIDHFGTSVGIHDQNLSLVLPPLSFAIVTGSDKGETSPKTEKE